MTCLAIISQDLYRANRRCEKDPGVWITERRWWVDASTASGRGDLASVGEPVSPLAHTHTHTFATSELTKGTLVGSAARSAQRFEGRRRIAEHWVIIRRLRGETDRSLRPPPASKGVIRGSPASVSLRADSAVSRFRQAEVKGEI